MENNSISQINPLVFHLNFYELPRIHPQILRIPKYALRLPNSHLYGVFHNIQFQIPNIPKFQIPNL
jgi:hypothetical protein